MTRDNEKRMTHAKMMVGQLVQYDDEQNAKMLYDALTAQAGVSALAASRAADRFGPDEEEIETAALNAAPEPVDA